MNPDPQNTEPQIAFASAQIQEGIERLAQGILAQHQDPSQLALVGIHTGGDLLLRRIEADMARLANLNGLRLDKGLVDISFYRDDRTRLGQMPRLEATNIPFSVEDRGIILIDDVIFTGRTVRAALDAIFSLGRPAFVELAVLVDRGHREFPIAPDYIGLDLGTERNHSVNVYLFEEQPKDHATLEKNKYAAI